MREIKFRAWDEKRKEMNYKLLIGNLDKKDKNYTAGCIYINNEWVNYDEISKIKIMQDTGFKDKNGEIIYEGDIVNAIAENEYLENSGISDVIFCNDTAFTIRYRENSSISYNHGLSLSWNGWESFEIIGNIYENPELLEK